MSSVYTPPPQRCEATVKSPRPVPWYKVNSDASFRPSLILTRKAKMPHASEELILSASRMVFCLVAWIRLSHLSSTCPVRISLSICLGTVRAQYWTGWLITLMEVDAGVFRDLTHRH